MGSLGEGISSSMRLGSSLRAERLPERLLARLPRPTVYSALEIALLVLIAVQAARLLWLRAGFLKNAGRRNTRETGLAKWFATVASERAAGDAVQVHGANGYSDEYPVGRFYRNCKGAVIYEGTREIHKIMQADYVLGFREDKPTRCELPVFGDKVRA